MKRKLKSISQRILMTLKIFRHEWLFIGTGEAFHQPSAFYECKKCGNVIFTVKGHKGLKHPKRGCIR